MTPDRHNKSLPPYRVALKLVMPKGLRDELKQLAAERAVSVSALIRLILTEYVRSKT